MSGQHKGGWSEPVRGTIDGHEVTASFGEGNRSGETLIRDGHEMSDRDFMQSQNHNHYGSGAGPNDNSKDRGQYSGPGR